MGEPTTPADADHAIVAQAARALLASVDHDNNGDLVGTQYMGGSGGTISIATCRAADALRLALDRLEQTR